MCKTNVKTKLKINFLSKTLVKCIAILTLVYKIIRGGKGWPLLKK